MSAAAGNSTTSKQLNRILHEQQVKQQHINCIKHLQQGLQQPQSLIAQTVAAYSHLLDGKSRFHGILLQAEDVSEPRWHQCKC